ncbi:taste receptor type 2 member 40-like [Leptodactylus fuscus]|uniref:taste receptor type 2 member 40-like n=1 Tax=Leptodactylus fuscus TaxID=238119 RepID=UPI003F4EF4C2
MLAMRWILLLIFGILDSGTAFILNIWILVIGARSLKTGKRLNPPDLIHLVIGAVNVALQCFLVSKAILSIFFTSVIFVREVYVTTIIGTHILMYFTYWLTAWLCLYYCVTICNFSHPMFLWLRRNISMYLPHLLLLSAVGCFFISLPTIWTANVKVTLQYPANSSLNPIFISGTFSFKPFYIQTASFMGSFLPFILIFVSILVTTSSLLRHLWKMRQKVSGLSQAKNQAHINAIRTMFMFLALSIIFYINEILFFSVSANPEVTYTIVNWMIFITFPTAESLIIIFSNPKLRNIFMEQFLWFTKKL